MRQEKSPNIRKEVKKHGQETESTALERFKLECLQADSTNEVFSRYILDNIKLWSKCKVNTLVYIHIPSSTSSEHCTIFTYLMCIYCTIKLYNVEKHRIFVIIRSKNQQDLCYVEFEKYVKWTIIMAQFSKAREKLYTEYAVIKILIFSNKDIRLLTDHNWQKINLY